MSCRMRLWMTRNKMFNLRNSGFVSERNFFGCPKGFFSRFTFKIISVRKLACVTNTRKIKKENISILVVITFSLSTLP
jgi:hypothetical protein